jgi:diguanylate cyclase (GGDEF)-like protein
MQLINNQYKVLDIINEGKTISTYKVQDILKVNLLKYLMVMDHQKETEGFFSYMKDNIYDYANFNHPNLVQFYFFNKINQIDNKPVSLNKYYFTYEYFEGKNLFDNIGNLEFGERLDLAVQLCAVFKYLHLRGFLLCNINKNDLYIIRDGNKWALKVASFPYHQNLSSSIIIDKDNKLFKAPELYRSKEFDKSSDIYALGIIMYYILSNTKIENANFREDIQDQSLNSCKDMILAKDIIIRCTSLEPTLRYQDVIEIVKDINKTFNKNYNIIKKEYIETMPRMKAKLIPEQKQLNKIADVIVKYFYENNHIKAVKIDYTEGAAQDDFTINLSYRCSQEGFSSTVLSATVEQQDSFEYITPLIKDLIARCDKELISKYYEILSIATDEIADQSTKELSEELKLKYKYRLINFISEVSAQNNRVLIAENYYLADKDSLDILSMLLQSENNSNLFLTFGADELMINYDHKVKDLCKFFDRDNIIKIKISNYSISETADYIKNILGTTYVPLDFITNVFKHTEGAPEYIYNLVYMLFNNKSIYVNDEGYWAFDKVNFDNIDMLFNLDEITLNKIANLRESYQRSLVVASIFEASTSPDLLAALMGVTSTAALEILNFLSYMNILIKKVDDWGITYDFRSASLKKTIYDRISEENKVKYHYAASIELEGNIGKGEYKNSRELIYQLIKSNRFDKAIELLIKSAEEFTESSLTNQAIQTLNQAYELLENHKIFCMKSKVCLELGKLYMFTNSFENSLDFFNKAEKLAQQQADTKTLIDIYIDKINILHRIKNDKQSFYYIKEVKKLLKTVDYYEGLYEYILSLNDVMMDKRKYNSFVKILNSVLKMIDKDKHQIYYGRILVIYGIGLMQSKKLGGSIDILQEAASIFEKLGAYKYLPQVYNAIGTVYIDLFNDYVRSKEYFDKGISISLKVNNQRYAHIIYNNIAEINREQDKYVKALEYYRQSLDIGKITQHRYSELLVELNISLLRTSMEDYYNALKNFDNVQIMINESNDIGDITKYLYEFKAEYYYRLGYFEMARDYAQKSVDMCISWGVPINMEAILLKRLSEVKLTEKLDYQEDLKLCKEIFQNNLYKLGRVACFQLAEIYAENSSEEARAFLKLGLSFVDKIETGILKAQYRYMDAITGTVEEKQDRLIEAAAQMESIENLEIKWKTYKAIGECCVEQGEYQEGLKHYISALNILRKLVHNVPDEYKTTFVMSHNRNTVKEGLKRISETIMQSKKAGIEVQKDMNKVTLQNLDKYFDYTNYVDIYREGEKEETEEDKVDAGTYNKLLNKLKEVISNFTESNIDNIKNIVNLCAEVTQSKNAFLATLDEEDNLNILASYNRYSEIPFYKYVIEQVRQKKDSIIVTDVFDYNKNKGDLLIPKEMTAVYCIPIMSTKEEDGLSILKERRRQKQTNESSIIGYLYLDTDSIINNFTTDSGHFCKMLGKMAYILVDNYNLKIVSTVDKLTKLYTRKYFETALQSEIAYAEREGTEFSIIMIDIDKFKTVNDRFGHQKGDEILQGVSGIIINSLRKGDIAARYGGEEIIILLPNTGEEEGTNVAEKLRRKVENARLLGLHNPLTISLGVSTYPRHSSWAKDLIEKADQALYYAKENGRNKSILYKEDMSKTTKRIDKLAGIISGNLVEDQRKVETMLEVLELQRSIEIEPEEKLFNFLGRIIEVSEAQMGILFEIGEAGEIKSKLVRKKFISTLVDEEYYNEEIVAGCIDSKAGEYKVDWNSDSGLDTVTGMPDWQSIMTVPMTKEGKISAVLYLSVSIKTKEFDAGEYNYLKTLCDIFSRIYQ